MMKKLLKYILPVLTAVASGCGSEEVAPPAVEEPSQELQYDEVMLCLNVSYDGVGSSTRAEGDPDRYEGIDGKYETVETLRVLIVRDIQTDADGKTTAVVEGNRLVATNEQGYPMYDNLEFKVLANSNKRIYLIANEKYLPNSPITGQKVSVFLDSYTVSTPKEEKRFDIGVLSGWTVSVPDITASTTTVTTDKMGMFQPSDGKRLPLTEFFDVEVGRKDETTDNRWFSHLFLTRCAAKARFFLNVGENFKNDGAVNPEIKSISLSGVGTKEYVFPNNTVYSIPKDKLITSGTSLTATLKNAYIKTFATPADNQVVTYLINDVDLLDNVKIVETPKNSAGNMLNYPINNNFLYFAESILNGGQEYEVTVELTDGRIFKAPLKTDAVTGNTSNVMQIGGNYAISRNTYLPILINFTGALDISVEVLPWTPEYYEFDFSDHVAMSSDGALTFVEGSYAENGLDKANGRLVLPDYPLATTGTFTIGSPVGHRWDAYIVTKSGELNAIQFLVLDKDGNIVRDEDGNIVYTDHISGLVGDKAVFKVGATMSAGSGVQREAIMQVMVTLDYGDITVPVNVLESDTEYGAENITFVQNPQ